MKFYEISTLSTLSATWASPFFSFYHLYSSEKAIRGYHDLLTRRRLFLNSISIEKNWIEKYTENSRPEKNLFKSTHRFRESSLLYNRLLRYPPSWPKRGEAFKENFIELRHTSSSYSRVRTTNKKKNYFDLEARLTRGEGVVFKLGKHPLKNSGLGASCRELIDQRRS